MQLIWREPGFDYSMKSIMQFQTDEAGEYWMEPLYYFFPEIKREVAQTLSCEARAHYIGEKLQTFYAQEKGMLEEKVEAYQKHWENCKEPIVEAFCEAFEMDCRTRFENITGNITLGPIAPRYLEERAFDVFYLNSERGALGLALHEMIHFVWFDVWKRHFGDDDVEYEIPHLPWILSEMTVEPIMRDPRLASVNPYFERDYEKKENGCVYGCFYDMKVDGEPILETLYRKYRQESITDYMEWAYAYCQTHEKEIRGQMREVLGE